jgi:hypothetical protein
VKEEENGTKPIEAGKFVRIFYIKIRILGRTRKNNWRGSKQKKRISVLA